MLNWLFPTYSSCLICNREDFSSLDMGFCEDCFKSLPFAKDANALFKYEGEAQRLIQDLKYNNKRYLAEVFARLAGDKLKAITYDVICFVPTRNKKIRGYNQAELIARAIDADKTVDALEKIKDTPSQTSLSREKRLINVKDCFRVVNQNAVKGRIVLLVDDVYTTGSTMGECKNELLKAGALSVCMFTVCKA
ncbi:MAG: ComF family protein [Clostridia bacterium]|nr:ComF family protein [Clostridia bacterium]